MEVGGRQLLKACVLYGIDGIGGGGVVGGCSVRDGTFLNDVGIWENSIIIKGCMLYVADGTGWD